MTDKSQLSPGEARTRQRQRRQLIYFAIALLAGGLIGFFVGFYDEGDGSLFNGDWEQLKLAPAVAITLALGLIAALLFLPLWGFREIDDYKRQHNFIGFTGGCLAVVTAFPVWAVLYAGGFAPPPHAFGLWAVGFGSMMASFLFAKLRG